MSSNCLNKNAIDIVFTWVDGNDEAHINKMKPFLKKSSNSLSNKKFKTRYEQVNELEYSVNSIIKFAPFVKTIFIVTDNQIPGFVEEYNNTKQATQPSIKLIDHKDIFLGYESILPVFTSRPIESMLFNIPELSDNFVYFNDDFSLIKTTKPQDFFCNDLPVIRGIWTNFDENIWYKKLHQRLMKIIGKPIKENTYGYKRGQQKAAKIVGMDKYFKINHGPSPLRKSTLKKFYDENPDILAQNVLHRFRNPAQYLLQSLANHLEILNSTCNLKEELNVAYFMSYKLPLWWYKLKFNRIAQDKTKLFLCLQSLDLCPPKKRKFLLKWLENNNR